VPHPSASHTRPVGEVRFGRPVQTEDARHTGTFTVRILVLHLHGEAASVDSHTKDNFTGRPGEYRLNLSRDREKLAPVLVYAKGTATCPQTAKRPTPGDFRGRLAGRPDGGVQHVVRAENGRRHELRPADHERRT
jgi:hypothetical protein